MVSTSEERGRERKSESDGDRGSEKVQLESNIECSVMTTVKVRQREGWGSCSGELLRMKLVSFMWTCVADERGRLPTLPSPFVSLSPRRPLVLPPSSVPLHTVLSLGRLSATTRATPANALSSRRERSRDQRAKLCSPGPELSTTQRQTEVAASRGSCRVVMLADPPELQTSGQQRLVLSCCVSNHRPIEGPRTLDTRTVAVPGCARRRRWKHWCRGSKLGIGALSAHLYS